MKKIKYSLFILLISLTFSVSAHSLSAAQVNQTKDSLCMFAENLFISLNTNKSNPEKLANDLEPFTSSSDPEVQRIASTLIEGLKLEGSDPEEIKEEAVSDLGRLIKCSVKAKTDPCSDKTQLKKSDLAKALLTMETILEEIPKKKDVSPHQLMIEAFADHNPDIALFAYFKIAESRCFE